MPEKVLIDTDVLIDYLRGLPQSAAYLEGQTGPLHVSVVTVAELFAGVRDGAERDCLETLLEACVVIELDRATAAMGGLYRHDYGKSHGVGLADAMIAATAARHDLTIVTLGKKHYPMLERVHVPYGKN